MIEVIYVITPDVIARINELARKQRERTLTAAEKDEQAKLRRLYVDNIKGQVKTALDSAVKHAHPEECDCGCHHKH
jgi:uncharacterized protein YnzC (UPF0291/DUF896 family)